MASVSWTKEGRSLAVAGSSGPVGHRAAGDGALLETWAGHEGGTFRATFGPVGSTLLSVGQDGQVRFGEPGHILPQAEVKVPAHGWNRPYGFPTALRLPSRPGSR